jgi:vacuolar protein-sorting-associated protein 4
MTSKDRRVNLGVFYFGLSRSNRGNAKTGGHDEKSSNVTGSEKKGKDTILNKFSLAALEQQLSALLESTLRTSRPQVTWDQVAGLKDAKTALQMAAEMPRKQPQLFAGQAKPTQSILLYGPPGTGKGHIVRALAYSVDSTLFVVSVSDVKSKWVGESERYVLHLVQKTALISMKAHEGTICKGASQKTVDNLLR